jgi:hypothetical protein
VFILFMNFPFFSEPESKLFVYLFFIRQYQTRKAEIIFKSKAQGRSKVSMVRLRWMEDAENYLRQLKAKRRRRKANNIEEWASLLTEDKIILLFRLLIVLRCSSILCPRISWKMLNRTRACANKKQKEVPMHIETYKSTKQNDWHCGQVLNQ